MIKSKCPKCGKKFVVEENLLNDGNFATDFLKEVKKANNQDKEGLIISTLRSQIEELQEYIKKITKPPLIIAKVVTTHKSNNVVIEIPNKNKFLVDTVKNLKLKIGDEVVCQQDNLRVVAKVKEMKSQIDKDKK